MDSRAPLIASGALSGGDLPRRLDRAAGHFATAALALIAVKPLLDIGERDAGGGVDLGVLLSAVGAGCMVAALAAAVLATRRLPPRPVLAMLLALALLLVVSGFSYLVAGPRADLLALFDIRRYSIYGPHLDPATAIPAEAVRLLVSFAPVALIGMMLTRPDRFPARRLAMVAAVVLAGAVVHCALAWLQVAGVVPYSFYFELPGQKIGRASGGYYHPMSLGRLLMFSVFLCYVLGDRLRLTPPRRYALVGLFVATGVVSLHRLTILCLLVIVVAFEARRLGALRAAPRPGRVRRWRLLAVAAGLVAAGGVAAALAGDAVRERAGVALTEVGSLDVRSDTFMHGRGAIWNDVARILGRSTPDVWLFGFGYEPWDMHNDLLRVLVVWGTVGLVVVVGVVAGLYVVVRRRCAGPAQRWALGVLYAVFVLFGLTQKPMAYPYFMWLFLYGQLVILSLAGVTVTSAGGATVTADVERGEEGRLDEASTAGVRPG
ncbi:hypothetical protein E1258_21160 [Micromonospora sp. KC207]|uniref:hypothetical protein n=1 Tax=Micromonospora sp. KC207 TaxID=2530377 RepID=UPI00105069CF|nr:hypothetical protein [Micromonospora sp. KC207]TDC58042.1 hypothetical protein E1258_21160 [Micromonospora sp. KC207]